jgi:hypothetical protein
MDQLNKVVIKGKSRKIADKQIRGQALVEFSIALPLLLFVFLGLLEAARWFHSYLAVQYASREAARFAVTGNPPMYTKDGDGSCEELGIPGSGMPHVLPLEYDRCRLDYIEQVGINLSNIGLLSDPGQGDITRVVLKLRMITQVLLAVGWRFGLFTITR